MLFLVLALFFAQICQMPVHFHILTFNHVVSCIGAFFFAQICQMPVHFHILTFNHVVSCIGAFFFAQIYQMPIHFHILTFYHVVSCIPIIIFMFAITLYFQPALNKCPFSTLFTFCRHLTNQHQYAAMVLVCGHARVS